VPPYSAIFFDLGKVLIDFDFDRFYDRLREFCPLPPDEIRSRLRATGLVERIETGLIEPRPFFEEVRRVLELDLEYERFAEVWSVIFTDTLTPESLLEGLSRRYRLILVSNTNVIHFDGLKISHHHLLRHFYALVVSHEVKAMKPDPAIYRAALAHAGCPPAECFYTDDIPAYIDAARGLGIDAEVFQGRARLEAGLARRGIVWE
jgi:glucose-1-phosphatase